MNIIRVGFRGGPFRFRRSQKQRIPPIDGIAQKDAADMLIKAAPAFQETREQDGKPAPRPLGG